jgi:hypothetical protein
MSDEVKTKDIGLADQLVMDDFVRTLIGLMFDCDNDTAELEVVLNNTDGGEKPRLLLELKLTAINGKPTQGADDAAG